MGLMVSADGIHSILGLENHPPKKIDRKSPFLLFDQDLLKGKHTANFSFGKGKHLKLETSENLLTKRLNSPPRILLNTQREYQDLRSSKPAPA